MLLTSSRKRIRKQNELQLTRQLEILIKSDFEAVSKGLSIAASFYVAIDLH